MELFFLILGIVLLSAPVLAAAVAYLILCPHYDRNYKKSRIVSGKVSYVKEQGQTPYLVKLDEDGKISDEEFKIVTCADIHSHSENSNLSFGALSRFIELEKPDLVILLGDNVVDVTDHEYHKKLIRFFEERKQYYGLVLGNHDPEKWIRIHTEARAKELNTTVEELPLELRQSIVKEGRSWAFEAESASPYCIVFDEEPSLQGAGNCVVNIKNSRGIVQSLFFIDSGDYVIGLKRKAYGTEKRSFGYIQREQLSWYERRLDEITGENGGITPKSMAFFHIPLQEYEDAFRAARFDITGRKRVFGTNFEKPCYGDVNDGAFRCFADRGSTQICVCGHDHKNDSVVRYGGMTLMYSMGLPFDGAYNRHKKDKLRKLLYRISPQLNTFSEGVSVFFVRSTGEVEIHARYAHDIDAYRGLEQYFKAAWFL